MRVTGLDLYSEGNSNPIELSLKDPGGRNPYNIRAMFGLDADAIVHRYFGVSSSGQTRFYSQSIESRDVVLRIGLSPTYGPLNGVSDLRDDIYRLISSSRSGLVELRFKNEAGPVATLSGFVSKVEVPHFSKVAELQLTVSCEDALLRSPGLIEANLELLDSADATVYDANSTAPHGMLAEIKVLADTPSIKISDLSDTWFFEVARPGGFYTDDILYLSNERRTRSVVVESPPGTFVPVGESIVAGSAWPVVFPGENHFVLSDDTKLEWVRLAYYNTYWGV